MQHPKWSGEQLFEPPFGHRTPSAIGIPLQLAHNKVHKQSEWRPNGQRTVRCIAVAPGSAVWANNDLGPASWFVLCSGRCRSWKVKATTTPHPLRCLTDRRRHRTRPVLEGSGHKSH